MKLTDKVLPTYSEFEHYAWEVYLHGAYAEAEQNGKEISFDGRKQLVDDYVRKNPNTADYISRCDHCKAAAAEALLSGKPNVLSPRDVQRVLSDFGIRGDVRKSTGVRKNGKSGDYGSPQSTSKYKATPY